MFRKETIIRGLQACAPKRYRQLTALSGKDIARLCWSWFGLTLVLLLLAGIPKIVILQDSLQETFGAFDDFTVSFNVSMHEPVTVTRSPLIVISLGQENMTKERVLLNDEGIHVRKPLWLGERTLSWETLAHVPENASRYTWWVMVLIVLLIPSFLLGVSILFLIEAAALVALSVLLGSVLSRLMRFRVSLKQLVKVSTLALIPFMVVQLAPLFYLRWFVVPVVLYALLVLAAVWVVGESRMERRASRDE